MPAAPTEGKPIALNIGTVGRFKAAPEAVTAAIRNVIARYDALRARFEARDGGLLAVLNPAEAFQVEQEDLRSLSSGRGTGGGRQGGAAILRPAEPD